jgi:hypothetical protein
MSGTSSDPKVVEGVDLTIIREKGDSRKLHPGTLPVHDKEENALEVDRFQAKRAISAMTSFRGGRQSIAIVSLLWVPVVCNGRWTITAECKKEQRNNER